MMTLVPKVSVVLPVLSRPRNLNRAIASVLKQGLSELELIVVDAAGSDAGVSAAVAAFSASDARVHYLKSESSDAATATALGIRTARAPWIAFQRDGDEWLLDRLGQQLACAEQHGGQCHLVAGRLLQYMPVALTQMVYWRTSPSGVLDAGEAGTDLNSLLQTALIRRSAIGSELAFDVQGSMPQGLDWCRRLIGQGNAVAIPGCSAVTYVSSGIRKPNRLVEWFSEALKR